MAAAVILKVGGLLYSLLIVGLASRTLSVAQSASLLNAFNIFAALGLIQAGIGTLVLRVVAKANASGVGIADLGTVRRAFWTTCSLGATAAFGAVIALYLIGNAPLIPAALLQIVGIVCSIADQVRVGEERSWSANGYLAIGYMLCTLLYFLSVKVGMLGLVRGSVLAYNAPAFGSILSFSALLARKDFRRLLFRRSAKQAGLVTFATPMLLVSVGSAILLNVPASGALFPWFPRITPDDVTLFRLCTITITCFVVISAPILPTLIRYRWERTRSEYLRSVALYLCVYGCGALVACAVFAFGAEDFTRLWLGRGLADHNRPFYWAFVLWLWIFGALVAQYVVLDGNAKYIAAILLLADAVALLTPVFHVGAASLAVCTAMGAGIFVYCAGSSLGLIRELGDGRSR